MQRII
ncbi:hypothetical protein LINPERPRIM_LOCUS22749 [Linum perenne]